MPCKPFNDDQGNFRGFACSRGGGVPKCETKGCNRQHTHLCDKPIDVQTGATCDRKMCSTHRVQIARGRDYCQEHGAPELAARKQIGLRTD